MNLGTISVGKDDGQLIIECPYSPAFHAAATVLGGRGIKFGPGRRSTWAFDPGREHDVRKALVELYGTDGSETPETITVHVVISTLIAAQSSLWLGGWLIASRDQFRGVLYLDPAARVVGGPGFLLATHDLKFPPLGGAGTVLEITEFPKPLAERLGLVVGPVVPRHDGPAILGVTISEMRARIWELGAILEEYPDSQIKFLADQQLNQTLHDLERLRDLVQVL